MTAVVVPRTGRGWLAGVVALACAAAAAGLAPRIWRWAPLLAASRPDPVCGRNSLVARIVGVAGYGLAPAVAIGVPIACLWLLGRGRRGTAVAATVMALSAAGWWWDVAPRLVNHGCF